MKVSKAFKRAITAAAKELGEGDQISLDRPFQESYVAIIKPQQIENVMEIKFRELEIDRDGSFFLITRIM